jgi:hypothetical protein
MRGYIGEHPIMYLASTGFVGGTAFSVVGFARRENRPEERVELGALYGAIVGIWVGLMLILFDPILH